MSLDQELEGALREAMRTGDAVRRDTVRQLRGALHNETIARGHPLSDLEELAVVSRLVNQHRDSISEFTKGGRSDLVEREEAELEILLSYLPQQLNRDAIVAAATEVIQRVGASGRGDQGKVMRDLAPQLRGTADMRLVNEVVQELLE